MDWARMLAAAMLLGAGASFAQESSPPAPPPARPAPEMLQGLSPEKVMQLVDDWGMDSERNKVTSYITDRQIHVEFPDGPTVVVELPADRMLVAVAPYIRKTHDCSTHYPSGCSGELPNTEARVTVTDAGGAAVLDLQTRTLANGFLELWLPRNALFHLSIEARGLKAGGPVSTADKADTCLTTFQLHP
jgi:hypothetical protein